MFQFDIYEVVDYEKDFGVIENVYYKIYWIFGNGYLNFG